MYNNYITSNYYLGKKYIKIFADGVKLCFWWQMVAKWCSIFHLATLGCWPVHSWNCQWLWKCYFKHEHVACCTHFSLENPLIIAKLLGSSTMWCSIFKNKADSLKVAWVTDRLTAWLIDSWLLNCLTRAPRTRQNYTLLRSLSLARLPRPRPSPAPVFVNLSDSTPYPVPAFVNHSDSTPRPIASESYRVLIPII